MTSEGPSPGDTVARGVLIAIGLHLIQFLLIPAISVLSPALRKGQNDLGLAGFIFALGAWSLTQFLYLGPAAWLFWRRGEREKVKGILIVAGLGVLLNGACDLAIFRSFGYGVGL